MAAGPTKAELAQLVKDQAAAIASLQGDAKVNAKQKTERKLKVTTAREWTGSNTMLATYRSYGGNTKTRRGARLYRDEVDAVFSEFDVKLTDEQRENVDAFFAPMSA